MNAHTKKYEPTREKERSNKKLWRKQFAFSEIKASKFTHFLNLKYLNKVDSLCVCGKRLAGSVFVILQAHFVDAHSCRPFHEINFFFCASRLVFSKFNFLPWRVYLAMHTELFWMDGAEIELNCRLYLWYSCSFFSVCVRISVVVVLVHVLIVVYMKD